MLKHNLLISTPVKLLYLQSLYQKPVDKTWVYFVSTFMLHTMLQREEGRCKDEYMFVKLITFL